MICIPLSSSFVYSSTTVANTSVLTCCKDFLQHHHHCPQRQLTGIVEEVEYNKSMLPQILVLFLNLDLIFPTTLPLPNS